MEQPDYIQAILTNNRKVLKAMYHQFSPMVRKMILELGGTEEDAKDVFQEAVMVIFFMAQGPDFQLTSQFSTLFYSVARNRWLSRRKKKSFSEVRIPEGVEYIAYENPAANEDNTEQRLLLYRAISHLGEDCRALLLLFFERKTMAEIAQAMGYASENYAARRKHTCKERLVELVKSYPEYQELRTS